MDYPYSMNLSHGCSTDGNHVLPLRVLGSRPSSAQSRYLAQIPQSGTDSETGAASEYFSVNHGHNKPSTSYNSKRHPEVSKDETKSRFKTLFSPSKEKEKPSSVTKSGKESDHADNTDKVKTKILSMWNNVKNGWTMKMKTSFSKDAVIWLLGQHYYQRDDAPYGSHTEIDLSFEEFRKDFYSRIWLTYRREFPSLAGSNLTTDCGWGCMLRSGQMMLAEAFIHHFLSREWRWQSPQTRKQDEIHHTLVQWFGDSNNILSPFSLHHLVALGESSGKKAGDWYGPASVAHILKQAMENASGIHPLLNELCIYVAQDCTVYKRDVLDLCKPDDSSPWKGIVILIPVRLGGEAFNPIYTNCIKIMLTCTNCLGIIGGRPKHSLYFIGWQDEKLIHLDPHYCQEVVDVTTLKFDLKSFHCSSPRKMSFSRMDPSCTIGFYCESDKDFETFESLSKQIVLQTPEHEDYPIFVVAEGRSSEYSLDHCFEWQADDMINSWKAPTNNSFDSDDSEEFVVL